MDTAGEKVKNPVFTRPDGSNPYGLQIVFYTEGSTHCSNVKEVMVGSENSTTGERK